MMSYSVKGIREKFKSQGIFYTPVELCLYLKSFLPEDVDEVYDPTCGRGNLLSVFDDNVKKYGQDLNEEELIVARETLVNFTGEIGDTLKNPAFIDKKFKNIIANPPFSVKWDQMPDDIRFNVAPALAPASKADWAFMLHILHMLDKDGVAVVMNFPGVLYRRNAEGKIRKWFVENNYIDKVVHIQGDKFEDTKIATCLIILKKNKINKDVLFIDSENDMERLVTFEEIEENDFNLSVNTYIQKEEIKEEIDIEEFSKETNELSLRNIEVALNFNLTQYQIFGVGDFMDFINKLKKLIEEYERKYLSGENIFDFLGGVEWEKIK